MPCLPLTRFYQFGFIAGDLDFATHRLGERYGIRHFRRKRANDWMESAHAYVGETMIEIISTGPDAPGIYTDHLPEGGAVRLHHLGYRVPDVSAWEQLESVILSTGIAAPMKGTAMNGHLRFAYLDTLSDLGLYTEYVCLTGPAERIYDDVPRN